MIIGGGEKGGVCRPGWRPQEITGSHAILSDPQVIPHLGRGPRRKYICRFAPGKNVREANWGGKKKIARLREVTQERVRGSKGTIWGSPEYIIRRKEGHRRTRKT